VKRITIGGVGSVLLGDDGVGPYVIHTLESNYCFEDCVAVIDLGTPGLDLVAYMSDADVLILIDSVASSDANQPAGTVTLYRRDDILRHGPAPVRMDPHSPALSESILIADFACDSPKEILLVGITGERYEMDSPLSPGVRQAVDRAVHEVLRELDRLEVSYWHKTQPDTLPAWWERTTEPCPV
jgi:hydrogenase maturation protease